MADLHYVLEVEPLDLGADVKAVGLDLMEVESREPASGSDATRMWAATLIALAGSLQLIVTPGPDPVKQADYDTHYQQWDAGGQMLQDLLDISKSMVGKIFDSSAPPLLSARPSFAPSRLRRPRRPGRWRPRNTRTSRC